MAPKAKRGQNDGSVFQRASDGRWVAQIFAGYRPNGTRRYVTRTARTETEAKRLLRDMLREQHAGEAAVTNRPTTVKAWSETWIELRATKLRPTPHRGEISAIRHWVIPTIGTRLLSQVTPADLRSVGRAVIAAGRSDTHAHYVQGRARHMLKDARAEGHAVATRVLEVPSPAKGESDRDAIPLEDVGAILRAVAELPHHTRWTGGFFQGIRQGEALGLTWDHVDLDASLIDVSWQLQELPYRIPRDRDSGFRFPYGYEARHLVGAYHLVRPKTARGTRLIPLVPAYRDQLAAWQEEAPDNPWGLVWAATDDRLGRDGRPIPRSGTADRREWHALQDAADVRHHGPDGDRHYSVHEVRHTTATALLAAGVDPHVVTSILGHSTITTSRGYMHVDQTMRREAMAAVAEHLAIGG